MSNIEVKKGKLWADGKIVFPQLKAEKSSFQFKDEDGKIYKFVDLTNSEGNLDRSLVIHNDELMEKNEETVNLVMNKVVFTDILNFVHMYESGEINPKPYKMETKLYNILSQFRDRNEDYGIKDHISNIMRPYHSFTCLDKIAEVSVNRLNMLLSEISDKKVYDSGFIKRFAACYVDTYLYPIKYETEVEKYWHMESAEKLLNLIKEKKIKTGLLHKPFITITLKTFARDSETETVLKDLNEQMNGDLAEATHEDIVRAAIMLMFEDAKRYAKKL